MSKQLFPNLSSGVPTSAAKTTRQNMDNVFNSLLNLSTYDNSEGMLQFRSILTITYNRIQVLYNEDPRLCLQHLKLYRKWLIEYLRGYNAGNPGVHSWQWDHVHGYPILLSDLVDFLSGMVFKTDSTRLLVWRISIALLSLDRVMSLPGVPSYDTITKPVEKIDHESNLYPQGYSNLISGLGFNVTAFRKRYAHECSIFEYEVLSSAGVNGKATWSAHSDAKAWIMNGDLLRLFKQFAKASKMEYMFNDLLGTVHVASQDEKPVKDLVLGRLHSFDELGGKVRTVAIVDYWTQMLFTPLHRTINHFLKDTPLDGTFDQETMAEAVRSFTILKDSEVYSFDLTAATDRLPVSLQEDILSHLLGNRDLAVAWRKILTMRSYRTADGRDVNYAVGQPMGARSSFAMLALTHHIIVQHAAALAKVPNFKSYRVLGDDMTLVGSNVATQYLAIMSLLGVPVNTSKSIIHRPGCKTAAEICKRVFIAGEEVTSIPVKLIAKTVRSGDLAPILHNEFNNKNFTFDHASWTGFFYSILNENNFKDLVTLNVLPSKVSGLSTHVPLTNVSISDYKNWFPGFTDFSEEMIVDVFTWTAAVESLKRLDALLRNTLAISAAISAKFSLYAESPVSVETLWEILGIPTEVPSVVVKDLIKDIDHLNASHPIIKATEAEIKRITEIMAGLISHNTEMYNKARRGLLDLVRNALTDVWTDTDAAKAAGIRTLTNKSLANLTSIVRKGSKLLDDGTTYEYSPSEMASEYTLSLQTIGRQWMVKLILGSGVMINSVKSSVKVSSAHMSEKITKTMGDISLGFHKPSS